VHARQRPFSPKSVGAKRFRQRVHIGRSQQSWHRLVELAAGRRQSEKREEKYGFSLTVEEEELLGLTDFFLFKCTKKSSYEPKCTH
jgi:hypothetical protein